MSECVLRLERRFVDEWIAGLLDGAKSKTGAPEFLNFE